MKAVRRTLRRLFYPFYRRDAEQNLADEMDSHIQMQTDENLHAGMSAEEARSAAKLQFGSVEAIKEKYRDQQRLPHIEGLVTDLRFGLRTLGKSRGFTIIAVVMLALGIGINSAVFTLVKAALFDGFPTVSRSERIVQITTSKDSIFYPDFVEWREQARSFQGMALVRGVFHTLGDDVAVPETYYSTEVTPDTFRLLGVRPLLGRDFAPSDYEPGAVPVVILRYDLWAGRFGADPGIVGQRVHLDGAPATVIAVMPQGFSFPSNQDLWTPLIPTPAALRRDTPYAHDAYARLSDGVSIAVARAEVESIARRLALDYPRTNGGVVPIIHDFEEWFIGSDAALLYKTLWLAVVFVLLVICANVANLLLERAVGRSHEISIRLALGAGRWRIVRQFLIEGLMLSAAGGLVGWWLAKAAVRIYSLLQVNGYARVLALTIDWRSLAYLVGISVSSAVLLGFAAARHLTKVQIYSTCKDDGRTATSGRNARRWSDLLIATEMVFAVTLLASAGVISRSFWRVYTAEIGVNPAKVLTVAVSFPPDRYAGVEARVNLYRGLETQLQAIPGVESVGFATAAPTDFSPRFSYELADDLSTGEQSRPLVSSLTVSTGYFRTLAARLIGGREFDNSDRLSSPPVVIVNQQFAERSWPGEVAIGKQLRVYRTPGKEPTPWLTVIGVVSNIVQNDRTRQARDPLVYLPLSQYGGAGFLFVRTGEAPASVAATVRKEIYAIDPVLALSNVMPLTERFERAYTLERNITVVFLAFSGVALFVASLGLYATVAHSVSKRVQEIGIRIAIGATPHNVVLLVVRQAMLPLGTGLSAGLALSMALNQALKSQLVGISPADPVTLAGATALLVASAALGCWIPARRATKVDPVIALKYE